MSIGRAGSEDYMFDDAIENGYAALGWGGDIDWSDARFRDYENVRARWHEIEPGVNGNVGNIAQVWRFLDIAIGDLVLVSQGNSAFRAIGEVVSDYRFEPGHVDTYKHRRSVRWLVIPQDPIPSSEIYNRSLRQASCYRLADEHLNRPVLERLINEAVGEPPAGKSLTPGDKQPNQFVLVVDEINRANMSKVFGELITLIEPDKRLGGENELTVTLPYSGKSFGVPANLHILGTMNTADRSIALLDTALRRRFEFRELMPDPSVLMDTSDGIPLANLLQRINERIEFLFDREHQIGHAYFIGCTMRADVDRVMRRKVIPLLAEYFYEDWSRIAAVLGDNDGSRFLEKTELRAPPGLEGEASEPRISWKVRETFAPTAYEAFR